MTKTRLGFIGTGTMGQAAHLRNYASLAECEVVAMAELRAETASRVASRYGVPHVYHDHRDMLAREKLDGIVCIQPFTHHGQLLPEVLRAGVPILTEKPLAASVAMGERIVQAAHDARTWHMVGYHKRSDPATIAAKAEIDRLKHTGEIGPLRYVRITMPPGDWIAGGFNDLINAGDATPVLLDDPPPADMDVDTFKDYVRFVNYYIHQVNLMRHMLGEAYRVVFVDSRDVLLVGESASGVTCTIEMAPYHTTVDWHESVLVTFERGFVRLDLPAPLALNRAGRVEIFRDPGSGAPPEHIRPELPALHAMRQQAIHFVRAIRGEMPPMCDSVEALEDLKLAREYVRLKHKVRAS